MEKPAILHMLTPARNMSPFDVNMAIDAGFQHAQTYGGVTPGDVAGLTQDAIFSRGPKGVRRTGIFVGGREIDVAAEMLQTARAAMTPPFVVSLFCDPSGSFTTAAGAVAALEHALAAEDGLADKRFLILGAGPVGAAAAVLAAGCGAQVRLASHSSLERARKFTDMVAAKFGAAVEPVCSDDAHRRGLLAETDILLGAAKAGVQVVSRAELGAASRLAAAADLNAVPPDGIEGLGVLDDRKPLAAGSGRAIGIGALAVGQVKYQTQRRLFEKMLAGEAVTLGLAECFEMARAVCRE